MNKKQGLYITLLLLLSLIFISAVSPISVSAADSSLLLKDLSVNAEVLKDGAMTVAEKTTFKFSGSYNGITKQISFKKSSGITDLNVYEVIGENKIPYAMVNSASNGDKNVYTVDKSAKDSWNLKIFAPSSNESRSFLVSYTLKDVATRYNDIGELNWNFIGTENQAPIGSVLINIKVPEGAKSGDLKVFAHGPLSGESKIVDNRTISLSINSLPPKANIEARVLFPKSLIPQCVNTVNENAFEKIMAQEKGFADEANKKREQARKLLFILNMASGILLLGTAFLAYILHMKYNKDPKPGFEGKYYRELPEDCTPAVMSAIYNYKNISTKDITATLMDLVRKKYLKIEITRTETKRLLGTKTKEDYAILKLKDPDNMISEHERYFLSWMMDDIGNGAALTFDDIESYTKSRTKAQKFKASYDAWSNIVKMQAVDKKVFDKDVNKGKLKGSLFGALDMVLGVIIIVSGSMLGLVVFFAGILLLIFSILFKKRTNYGSTQFAMWKAFKHFLKEFSNLKEAQIPSLIIWEHYLVYAISLGVAKEVIKQLKLIIPEDQYSMNGLTYLYMGSYMHGYGAFDHFDDFSSAFERTTNSAFTVANSSNSSSGGGGGFSSGSSGGGGGGGYGGF